MLCELSIEDFALIDNLRVQFSPGLIILTGETGAGKSIIIDALGLSLGERATAEQIRTGKESTSVEAIFDVSNLESLKGVLEKYGIEIDEDRFLIARREINREGRNRCFLNGVSVTLTILKDIGQALVDIHGQHEHQSILRTEGHVDLLDDFGSLGELKTRVAEFYRELEQKKKELKEILAEEKEFNRQVEFLTYQAKEIEGARLEVGEDDKLEAERVILGNAEELFSKATQAYSLLHESTEETPTVLDNLSTILENLNDIAKIDVNMGTAAKSGEEAKYQLEDLGLSLGNYLDRIVFDPKRLQEVEERLNLIHTMKKKYGGTVEEVISFGQEVKRKLENVELAGERKENLTEEIDILRDRLSQLSLELSDERGKAAKELESKVELELASLGMDKTTFQVQLTRETKKDGDVIIDGVGYVLYPHGIDQAEFMISPNLGEEPKPLRRTASGGEMSRIMLALKTILADVEQVPSMVFDEIDTGIGGGTAEVVGRKLSFIAGRRQVICITHLPQIASLADTHFYVTKNAVEDRTTTSCKELSWEERIGEVARMLGGVKVTPLTLRHAREMIGRSGRPKPRESSEGKELELDFQKGPRESNGG